MKKYRIINYGNTRKLPYKGVYYEITKNSSIETGDQELADALGEFHFIDVESIEQPTVKTAKNHKMNAAAMMNKKIKQCKIKGETKCQNAI